MIADLVHSLEDEQKVLIDLIFWQSKTVEEIAFKRGIRENTLNEKLREALSLLRLKISSNPKYVSLKRPAANE